MKWLELRIEAKIVFWSRIQAVDFTYVLGGMLFPSL